VDRLGARRMAPLTVAAVLRMKAGASAAQLAINAGKPPTG
jgi:hypothetical protein